MGAVRTQYVGADKARACLQKKIIAATSPNNGRNGTKAKQATTRSMILLTIPPNGGNCEPEFRKIKLSRTLRQSGRRRKYADMFCYPFLLCDLYDKNPQV